MKGEKLPLDLKRAAALLWQFLQNEIDMVMILWYKPFGKSGLIGGNIEVFIKAFLYANTKDESMKIITDILSPLNIEMGKTKIELEPYWKINGIYSIDVYVDLDASILQKEMLEKFLKTIANKWISYGEPVDEILISRNDKDIIIYNEKIEMIIIYIVDEN